MMHGHASMTMHVLGDSRLPRLTEAPDMTPISVDVFFFSLLEEKSRCLDWADELV